jgi:DNA-binding transcriptional MerR regulator
MNFFSISDIENLTNIKAHTIRTWEQRYGICSCKRKESKHRYYDGDDLKQILRIAWLYQNGHKISHIACLSAVEIKNRALGTGNSNSGYDIHINRLMESSIDLDSEAFDENLQEAINVFGFEKTILHIVFPFLNKLGLFWLTGHVIPAQEHFASSFISQKICIAIDQLQPKENIKTSRRVLLFTPMGEFHEIPLLFMSYLLKKNGIPFVYMGSAISIETLSFYCRHQSATELYFHLITNLTKCDIDSYLQKLADTFPDKQIFCSGVACNASVRVPKNVKILMTDEELMEYSKCAD